MIHGIARLDFPCRDEDCEERADFRVTRTNDELPDNFVQHGTRSLYYCRRHLPDDAKKQWGIEESYPDPAFVQRYDFDKATEGQQQTKGQS